MSAMHSIGDPKNPIQVNINEFKDRKYLDIRKYFTPKTSADPSLKPTQKGITLSKAQFEDLFLFFKDNYDDIVSKL